ncbi:B12-binding domain-containing radical SAM protein [Colwellia psychrerythraea]|uniref:Radical SAM domain/B12 binding domain protein n=1 Tax=Colwellia psychrerythraea (strain 34H / ATCC BAA-681) TaxID=167879 RepID=Q481X8_COLP3|nr:B12-binding domain-containing radical SAM protein [Colwellia psychrerythraea]AAZ25405.1 radical SAM domain/B12 binding domain protein [Colwellia psychrerythraea 34H]
MAEQSNHLELTVTQIPLTENSTLVSKKSDSIKEGKAVTHQSSQKTDNTSPKIVLATLNARYFHTSFGLRYLYANLRELQEFCEIKEFIIQTRAIDIVEQILEKKPDIVGFGVYIWNIIETTDVVNLLKVIAPEIKVVLGGPEVSYETEQQGIVACADYVLTGPADISFYQLCKDIINETPPDKKVLNSKPVPLEEIALPYEYYTDEDLKHRLLYVEASRGCPFKCEFCLSSLDKSSTPFELTAFLEQMEILYQRGARNFKFIDRTFNLNINTTMQIMQFFLDRMTEDLYLHFEVVPDHLPRKLKELLAQFPEGSLQFEIGIQTFNVEVQANISRKQNNAKSKENLLWLRDNTSAHIHADLIFGLPGETFDTFKDSFNQLYHCRPHEIQMGILKRLKGSPIIRHTESFDLRFNPLPPFNILSTDRVSFSTMQRINRFARYWDMIGNSGRFKYALPHMLSDEPFDDFMAITEWIFNKTGQIHKISLKKLFELISQSVEALFPEKHHLVIEKIELDYEATKLKSLFNGLKLYAGEQTESITKNKSLKRQQQHMS